MLVSNIFSTGGGRGCGGGERHEGRRYQSRGYGGGHRDWYESDYREGHRRNRRDREEFLEIAGIGIL